MACVAVNVCVEQYLLNSGLFRAEHVNKTRTSMPLVFRRLCRQFAIKLHQISPGYRLDLCVFTTEAWALYLFLCLSQPRFNTVCHVRKSLLYDKEVDLSYHFI